LFDVANDVRSSQPWPGRSDQVEKLRQLLGPTDLAAISNGNAMRLLPRLSA
jgi:hypothetical protein